MHLKTLLWKGGITAQLRLSANKIKGTSASEPEAQQLGLGECGQSREARVASSGTYHPHWERHVSSLLLNARAPGTSSAKLTTVPPDQTRAGAYGPRRVYDFNVFKLNDFN